MSAMGEQLESLREVRLNEPQRRHFAVLLEMLEATLDEIEAMAQPPGHPALQVEDEEMQRIVKEEGLEVLHPEYGTRPRVYYKNLDRFYRVFVGGSLAGAIDGVTECVEAARVVLEKDGKAVAEARSDAYGDFRFGGLEEDNGAYRLQISDARFAAKSIDFELHQSACLGTIMLELPGHG